MFAETHLLMRKLLLLLCLLSNIGFSQLHRIDSLKRELATLKQQPNSNTIDTLKYQILKAVMRGYVDINVDSSLRYNSLMIKLFESKRLQDELIYAYQYAGYLYQLKGDYYLSIQFYYKALALARKLKQYSRIAAVNEGLAHAYTYFDENEKALQLCQQGLAILHKYSDTDTKLEILNVLGVIYRKKRQLANALNVNLEMYRLGKSEGNQWYEAHGLHAIGLVYREKDQISNALSYHQQALKLAKQTGSIELEGNILVNIADLYIRQKKWHQALKYCIMGKKMATGVNNIGIIMEAEEKLYIIYKHAGQPQKALKAYETFVLLNENLSKEKAKQRIEMEQARYENIQKDNILQKQQVELLAQRFQNQKLAQIRNGMFLGIIAILGATALLFWNNTRLQSKNREIDKQRILLETARMQLADINKTLETRVEERTNELVKANQELIHKNEEIKNALFKGQTIERKRVAIELHDNLSSLLSAVNMSIQAINPENLSTSEQNIYRSVRQLIQNAYSEVRNISHNILPAKLEQEGLSATLTSWIEQLNQNASLQFILTITDLVVRLPIEIEFNIYSIVHELINNAIKHAKANTVNIDLCRTDAEITLMIVDDGIGLGRTINKRGVGLQNVQARLESLGGTFTIVLPTEKGTRIQIHIPIDSSLVNGNTFTT